MAVKVLVFIVLAVCFSLVLGLFSNNQGGNHEN